MLNAEFKRGHSTEKTQNSYRSELNIDELCKY